MFIGFYVSAVQTKSVLNKSVEEMCNDMRNELQNGCLEYESVKCGFIGEVGSSWPIDGDYILFFFIRISLFSIP